MKQFFILLSITLVFFTGCTLKNQPIEKEKVNTEKKLENQKKLETKETLTTKEDNTLVKKEEKKPNTEPKVIIKEKTKIVVVEKPVAGDSKIVIGSEEYIYIPSIDLTLKARIDTGATTTSLHALDIKEFERDGKKWVKFKFEMPNGKLIDKALPIEREVSIKRHGAKDQKRYVIKLRINLGSVSQLIDVSLTDRSKFSFPALIGRNFLNGYGVVDVSKKYINKPKKK